jgi:hypothetical protein
MSCVNSAHFVLGGVHELVQHVLHFQYLLVEAKGLVTSGNMVGAED